MYIAIIVGLSCTIIVLGNIRKIKTVWYCHCYTILLVFCRFTAISAPQCNNIYINCSLIKLKVTHRPNLPEVTGYKCILALLYMVCLSVNHSIYDFMAISKAQKYN